MSHERPVAPQPRPRRRGCALWWLLPLLLVLFPVLNRCSLFRPRGVTILVPEPKDSYIASLALSPDGTKLFYGFIFRRDLVTGKTHRLAAQCDGFVWLDNYTFFCDHDVPPPASHILVDVRDYSTTTIPAVDARKQAIAPLLRGAGQQVYELRTFPKPRVYLLRATQPIESIYLFNVAEDLQAMREVAVTFVPTRGERDLLNEPVVSPDGNYYYIHRPITGIQIYHKADDRLIRELKFNGAEAYVAGWMYDSSGVIYHIKRGAISFRTHPIYKLNVPRAGWRWPWE